MTNDNTFDEDFDIDEFGMQIGAMLTRRSRDVATHPRPLPSLAPGDTPGETATAIVAATPIAHADSGTVVRLVTTDTKNANAGLRLALAVAAAVVLIVGALVVFANQQSEDTGTSIFAGDPATSIPAATGTAVPNTPSTQTPVRPAPTPQPPDSWIAQEAAERLDDHEGAVFDLHLDEQVEAASIAALAELPPGLEGVTVTIDSKTGAIVGAARSSASYDYNDRHPIGSSSHLYALVAAFESGVEINDLLDGQGPCTVDVGTGSTVTLENHNDTAGSVDTLLNQFLRSSRCSFARLETEVGTDKVAGVLDRITIDQLTVQNEPLSSTPRNGIVANSGVELSVIEQANALATLVNVGRYNEPTVIRGATDHATFAELPIRPPAAFQRFDTHITQNALHVLQANVERGTASRAQFRPSAAAFTGTDLDSRRAWFVGVRGRLITAVLLITSDGEPMTGDGATLTGGSLPADTWRSIYTSLIDHPLAQEDGSDQWSARTSRQPQFIGQPPNATGAEPPPADPEPTTEPTQPPPPEPDQNQNRQQNQPNHPNQNQQQRRSLRLHQVEGPGPARHPTQKVSTPTTTASSTCASRPQQQLTRHRPRATSEEAPGRAAIARNIPGFAVVSEIRTR